MMNIRKMKRAIVCAALAALAPASRAAIVDISIKNFQFGSNNATVTVDVGDTVRWVNDDLVPHTVTSGPNRQPDGKFDSGNMDGGAVFSHTFTEAGMYPYYCDYHFGMESNIEVKSGGATVTIDVVNFTFGNNNAPVEINTGTTVVWRNRDAFIGHTITSGTRGAQDAGSLFDNAFTGSATDPPEFSFTFNEPGTYPYHCRPHVGMDSSIVVKPSAPTPVRGDINGDGRTDYEDLPMCLRVMCGAEMLPHGALDRMDVVATEGEAVFDMQDVVRIARFVSEVDTTPL